MIFGAYAFRSGLFLAGGSARRRRVGWWCVAIGLALSTVVIVPMLLPDALRPIAVALRTTLFGIGTIIAPVGYALLIVEYAPRWPAAIVRPLESTGRMALSVYLAESLICVTLASWWGFGWLASIADFKMSLIAIGLWITLVAFATLWLRAFHIGPAEWVWRRLSYGSPARVS